MKKLGVLLLGSLFMILLGVSVSHAHPPKDVNLTWNSDGNLIVHVVHAVNDPQKHYINKVIVYVNDKVALQRDYTMQQNGEGLTDTFVLGALPPGTNIKVEAYCIIMGVGTNSIVVP